jgi:hypothetical protein
LHPHKSFAILFTGLQRAFEAVIERTLFANPAARRPARAPTLAARKVARQPSLLETAKEQEATLVVVARKKTRLLEVIKTREVEEIRRASSPCQARATSYPNLPATREAR